MNGKQNDEPAAPLPPTVRKSALAKWFGVCTKTIDRHLDVGILPPPDFHVGRFPHWKVSSVEKWIETRKLI